MNRPIAVLQIIPSLSVGGAERLLPGLAARIHCERFVLHICSLGSRRAETLPIYGQLNTPLLQLSARRFADPRIIAAITRYIRTQQIDVVHTHLTDADVVGRIAARICRRPVASTLHNIPYDYERQPFHRRFLQRATAWLATDRLVAVSPTIRERYIAEWRIPPQKIIAIPNAVPMEPLLAVPEGVPAGAPGPVIVTIGRLVQQKAHHRLLEAAAIILQRHPTVRFKIVGQGPLEAQLRAQAEALGIAGQVEFTGVRHDIPEILGASDIFTLSSDWEGLPVTAVEALAAARPSVLTDVGGARDLVTDGVEGLIVPPGDAGVLAAALIALLEDPQRRLAMGRAARVRVQRDFNMETYTRQHEVLYEHLAQLRPSASPTGTPGKRGAL